MTNRTTRSSLGTFKPCKGRMPDGRRCPTDTNSPDRLCAVHAGPTQPPLEGQ